MCVGLRGELQSCRSRSVCACVRMFAVTVLL